MLFDCTGAGTVVDEWTPLFPVGDVVGHFDHEHVRWQIGPRGVHEYTAAPLYHISKGGDR